MQNRIIVPANYTIELVIRLDPVKGQSELQVRNRTKSNLSMLQVAGLLMEHAANVMRSILAGNVKLTKVEEQLEQLTEDVESGKVQ